MARYLNYSADEINALLAKITPMLSELAEVANGGAKNILENTNETKTIYDVVFTKNPDGSVTANGTATGSDALYVISNKDDYTAGKTYVLSGCPAGGGENTYRLQISGIAQDWGDGVEFESAASMNTYIRIAENYHADNLTFFPMIRPVEITDDSYVPYGKTNGDLTTEVTDIFNGVFGSGVTLASGDDLDDFTTPGKYAARSADIASGILHKPSTVANVAFCVEVSRTTASDRLTQTMYVNTDDGAFYQRKQIKIGSSTAWTGWYKFTGTAV